MFNIVDDEPAPVSEWLPHLAECAGAKPPRRIPAWLARLLQDAGDDVTVPVTMDNRLHPLCAVWHSTAAPVVRDALDAGIRTVREVVRRLRCRTIVVEDEVLVANVNTPGDWARFARGQE